MVFFNFITEFNNIHLANTLVVRFDQHTHDCFSYIGDMLIGKRKDGGQILEDI